MSTSTQLAYEEQICISSSILKTMIWYCFGKLPQFIFIYILLKIVSYILAYMSSIATILLYVFFFVVMTYLINNLFIIC
jgi:hypothetical protein